MISKKDFVKISDYLWEIPKAFRKDMRVPARIYASETMLEGTDQDALIQLVNLTALPGIQGFALAMPDTHTGYASPIGGVAAIRVSDGIISPGLAGYDINCLEGNAKILHSLGYYLLIKKFERKKTEEIKCANFQKNNVEDALILAFLKRKSNPYIFKIFTKSGQKIKATPDHPFYTPRGMIEARKLKKGDKIAFFPFEGVPYQAPSGHIIIGEEDIKKTLKQEGIGGSQAIRILNKLKKRNLLPLNHNHPKLPYLLKIMGFVFGDGSMNFIGARGDGIVYFCGAPPEDLEKVRQDIKRIGYTPSPVRYRKRKTKAGKITEEYSFVVNATSLVVFLEALGVPRGSKVDQIFRVPGWIFKTRLWQKRLFLASLFGSELSCPHQRMDRRGNFNAPCFPVGKRIELLNNAKTYLRDIEKLLKEFGVRALYIEQPRGKEHINVKGQASWGLSLVISPITENLLNLWGRVGFEYNQKRTFFANAAIQYLRIKQRVLEEKKEAIKLTIPQLLKLGLGNAQIRQQLAGNPLTKRFVESTCWKIKGGIKKITPRIPTSFPLFEDYLKQVSQGLGKSGIVWDEMERVERVSFSGYVYDFTVNHPNHNFIANGFVVSNCGMKLLKSESSEKEIKPYLESLAAEIQKEVPSGLGQGKQVKIGFEQVDKILEEGAQKLVEQGYGEKEDIENCEAEGRLDWADAGAVSRHAKSRGRDQVGSLGSGNHFMEVQKVEEIFDENTAGTFGLFKDQVVIMIHCGSRGLGHQVCTDYLKEFIPLMLNKYRIKVPDREFACVPFNSPEGQRYFSAMAAAANYAWANRQMIAHFVRKAWKEALGQKASSLSALYDVAHNIIKKEKYLIDGKETELAVHRKGATRAFPPGHSEIPERYKEAGQPVLIPGSMGTASYILAGTKQGEEAFFSTAHGAGRIMSRHAAMRRISGQEVISNLSSKGIIIKCRSPRGIAEEAPLAYKDIDSVIEAVHNAGLSKKVARLVPLAVIKGE